MCKLRRLILSDFPVMADEAAAFTIPCCVPGYHVHVYQLMWTPLLERLLLPSGTRITQVIAIQNNDINVHTAHCAALHSVE